MSLLGSAQDVFFDNFVTRVAQVEDFGDFKPHIATTLVITDQYGLNFAGPLVVFCLDAQALTFCERIRSHFGGFELHCIPPVHMHHVSLVPVCLTPSWLMKCQCKELMRF